MFLLSIGKSDYRFSSPKKFDGKYFSTAPNIYTDMTKNMKKSEIECLDSYFKNEYNEVSFYRRNLAEL